MAYGLPSYGYAPPSALAGFGEYNPVTPLPQARPGSSPPSAFPSDMTYEQFLAGLQGSTGAMGANAQAGSSAFATMWTPEQRAQSDAWEAANTKRVEDEAKKKERAGIRQMIASGLLVGIGGQFLPGVGGASGGVGAGTATGVASNAFGGAVAGAEGVGAGAAGLAGIGAEGVGAATVGGGLASLGGLGLPGWLTLGATVAQGLQGSPDQTTTSSNAPPAYLQPYLGQAAAGAQQQFNQGNYIAPIQQAASDYGTNVLTGNYLNSNPYLDATFNKAAGAVTNQVQSNFGRAGRNVRGPDAAGLATDKYNELATQIYGGDYEAERNRQQQILPVAGSLGATTNPSRALDDYIARLRNIGGGYGSTTSTTPTDSSWLSGLAGLGLALIPGH